MSFHEVANHKETKRLVQIFEILKKVSVNLKFLKNKHKNVINMLHTAFSQRILCYSSETPPLLRLAFCCKRTKNYRTLCTRKLRQKTYTMSIIHIKFLIYRKMERKQIHVENVYKIITLNFHNYYPTKCTNS